MFKIGDLVMLKNPDCPKYPLTYRVLRIIDDKYLIEAQINLNIGPTRLLHAEDLTLYQSPTVETTPQQWWPKI